MSSAGKVRLQMFIKNRSFVSVVGHSEQTRLKGEPGVHFLMLALIHRYSIYMGCFICIYPPDSKYTTTGLAAISTSGFSGIVFQLLRSLVPPATGPPLVLWTLRALRWFCIESATCLGRTQCGQKDPLQLNCPSL